jgi:hypothetical protein
MAGNWKSLFLEFPRFRRCSGGWSKLDVSDLQGEAAVRDGSFRRRVAEQVLQEAGTIAVTS